MPILAVCYTDGSRTFYKELDVDDGEEIIIRSDKDVHVMDIQVKHPPNP